MTIDVKRGRELEAAATPGSWVVYPHDNGAWLAERTHHAVGDPDAPDTRLGETGLADADLIVWLRNNCTALLDAAERVESLLSRVEDVTGATDAMTYEQACAALDAMTEERLATKEKLATAERRVAELEDRITDIADDALGLQVPGTTAVQMLDALEKRFHEHRVSAAQAERARDEAVRDRDTWRSACDAAGADLLAVSESLDCTHEQSMGPLLPGSREELLEAIRGLQESRGRAQTDSAEACGRMRQQKAAMREERDEALKEAHALRDLQAIVNRDGGHGSLADAIARVYAERAETDALRAQLAEALRRAEAARAILDKWCLPSLCVAGCKCAACRIRATLDPKGGK